MSEFKLCKNGHYYSSGLEECPYCPRPGVYQAGPNQLKNTVLGNLSQSDWDHTKVEASDPAPETPPVLTPPPNLSSLAKTQIFSPGGEAAGTAGRKLAGWLVSYTISPAGVDFRLYEGRNLIGADPGCDIVVPDDKAVSGRHVTILYRADGFRFKDEFSTNGTFINDEIRDEGILQDGDTIRIGSTILRFRSAL
jgi:hypothetical protein